MPLIPQNLTIFFKFSKYLNILFFNKNKLFKNWFVTKTNPLVKDKRLTFNGNFLVFTYFFKSHTNSKKNSLNFFLLSYRNKIKNINLMFLNLFFLGYNLVFFSNNYFKIKTLSYNWSALKSNNLNWLHLNYFIAGSYLNTFLNKYKFYFFKKLKNYVYYVIDSFSNRKILFYLRKIKKFTIATPFNKYIYSIISYPIIPINLTFNYNIFILIDFFYYYMVLFLKKSTKQII